MSDANVNTASREASIDIPTLEKHHSKAHGSVRRSTIFPGFNPNVFAARMRRLSTRSSIPRNGYERRTVRFESTYQMEPDQDRKVDMDQLHRVATETLATALLGYRYDASHARKFSSNLAERIRNEIKQLPYTRYKIVVHVVVGQRKSQGVLVASRCLWDVKLDRHITITKQTRNAYITVTIFLVYNE
ncbi:unnamed protein product [Adineta ricciae]|uniref:Uncharacterized protein n=1 Tax=Adineta ricciae TaxID=249248 RepID=A0A815S304_ADIRI|nr:unnamed protein product [Adineta ricciae]